MAAHIDFNLLYCLFVGEVPALADCPKATVVALCNFVAATARAENGRIIMRPNDGKRESMRARAEISSAFEYLCQELGHPYTSRAGQMVLMLIDTTYDTASERQDAYNELRSIKPVIMPNGMLDYDLMYRASEDLNATFGRVAVSGSGIPAFIEPMAQAKIYLTIRSKGLVMRDLDPIIADYLWAPSTIPRIGISVGSMIAKSPFVRWAIVTLAGPSAETEDLMAELHEKRPELLAHHSSEIEDFLAGCRPSTNLISRLAWGRDKPSSYTRGMAKTWGLIRSVADNHVAGH